MEPPVNSSIEQEGFPLQVATHRSLVPAIEGKKERVAYKQTPNTAFPVNFEPLLKTVNGLYLLLLSAYHTLQIKGFPMVYSVFE